MSTTAEKKDPLSIEDFVIGMWKPISAEVFLTKLRELSAENGGDFFRMDSYDLDTGKWFTVFGEETETRDISPELIVYHQQGEDYAKSQAFVRA